MSITLVKLDERQHATVLAALRFYQEHSMDPAISLSLDIHQIATNAGAVAPLDDEEIDELCEHVNCSPDEEDE